MSKPTFSTLERFLLHLGFQACVVPGSHVVFEHPEADTSIILRPYKAEDTIDAAVLAYVRRTLDEWGILARDQFDEQLRNRSLAG